MNEAVYARAWRRLPKPVRTFLKTGAIITGICAGLPLYGFLTLVIAAYIIGTIADVFIPYDGAVAVAAISWIIMLVAGVIGGGHAFFEWEESRW